MQQLNDSKPWPLDRQDCKLRSWEIKVKKTMCYQSITGSSVYLFKFYSSSFCCGVKIWLWFNQTERNEMGDFHHYQNPQSIFWNCCQSDISKYLSLLIARQIKDNLVQHQTVFLFLICIFNNTKLNMAF